MQKRFLSSVSAAGLFFLAGDMATAADLPVVAPEMAAIPAMDPLSAVFGFYGDYTTATGDEDDNDGDGGLLGGDARVNYWLTPRFSTQFDLHGEVGAVNMDDDDKEGARVNASVGGHVTWRNPDQGALGIFGGLTGGNILGDIGAESRYFIGLEGQYYLNAFTLYGQVGFHDLIEGDDDHSEMTDAWFARAVGRWFFTPHDKVEGEVAFNRSDSNEADQGPVETWSWGLLYEHQFSNGPFSAFVEYDGFDRQDDSHDDGGTEHIFMLGAKIYLNQPDLLTADRYGPTLDLPDLIRTENWADQWH